MKEIQLQNYGTARGLADAVKGNADAIMAIFDSVDSAMRALYGDAWQSSGADVSNGRYQELRKNYEIFYNKVIAVHQHIHKVTTSDEETDTLVGSSVSSI